MWGFLGGHGNSKCPTVVAEPAPATVVSESRAAAERLSSVCLEYAPEQLEVATDSFSLSRRLGAGGAGTVYRGTLRDGSDVGVKVIDLAALGDDLAMSGFEEEVAVLSKFRHPNLVVLMGWARRGDCRFLVYEFLPGGDLSARLRKCQEIRGQPFLWKERLNVALDAATGLAHLHNASPEAFHRDIKPPNILLGAGGAKVADFGLSCVSENFSRTKNTGLQCELPSGTPGYSCPHYLASRVITEAREVYSFGVVLLELLLNIPAATRLNGAIVFPIEKTVAPTSPGAPARVMAALDRTAGWPVQVAHEVAQLALACISMDEDRRPSFNQACRSLRSLRDRPANALLGPLPQHVIAALPTPHQAPLGVGHIVALRPCVAGVGQPLVQLLQPQPVPALGQVFRPGMMAGAVSQGPVPAAAFPRPAPAGPAAAAFPRPAPATTPPPALRAAPPGQLTPVAVAVAAPVPMAARGALTPPNGGAISTTPPRGGSVVAAPGLVGGSSLVPPGLGDLAVEARATVPDASGRTKACMLPYSVEVDGDGRRRARFGRQHQQQCLQELLSAELCACMSRTACELAWGGGLPPTVTALAGANLLSVDGCVVLGGAAQPGGTAMLRHGSQVAILSQERAAVVILVIMIPSHSSSSTYPAPAIPVAVQSSTPPTPLPAQRPDGMAWHVECMNVKGLTNEQLRSLPANLRAPQLPLVTNAPPVQFGRQHQPELFQALLANEPALCSQVSRTHLRLEAVHRPGAAGQPVPDGCRLQLSNVGSNPVLMCSSIVIGNGKAALLSDGQTFGFAVPATADSATNLVEFLTFKVSAPMQMPVEAAIVQAQPVPGKLHQVALSATLPPRKQEVALAGSTSVTVPVQVPVTVESALGASTFQPVARQASAPAQVVTGLVIGEHQVASAAIADLSPLARQPAAEVPFAVLLPANRVPRVVPPVQIAPEHVQFGGAWHSQVASVMLLSPETVNLASASNVTEAPLSVASSRTQSPREQDRHLSDIPTAAQVPPDAVPANMRDMPTAGQVPADAVPANMVWPQLSGFAAAPTVQHLQSPSAPAIAELSIDIWSPTAVAPLPQTPRFSDWPVEPAQAETTPWSAAPLLVLAEQAHDVTQPAICGETQQFPEDVSTIAAVPNEVQTAADIPASTVSRAADALHVRAADSANPAVIELPKQDACDTSARRQQKTTLSSASTTASARDAGVANADSVKLEVLAEHAADSFQADGGDSSPEASKRARGGCRCFSLRLRRRSKK